MSIGSLLHHAVRTLDEVCTAIQVGVAERPGGLISVFVHNVFNDRAEIERDLAYPQQSLTLAHLQQVLEYFSASGHRFVSGEEVIAGLPSDGRYVMLSFDDGYYNNQRALPLLEKYQAPALFYVPAQLVAERRGYWWDALYRHERRAGRSHQEIFAAIARRAVGTNEEIESGLRVALNVDAFKPVSDTDRLFTPEELRKFAAHPLVRIGNHGCVHEHLPSYPPAEAAARIQRAQQLLHEMTGQLPIAIAYPYGAVSDQVTRAAQEAGLKLGVTTVARKEYVTELRDSNRRMLISRFPIWGTADITGQCRYLRGDLMWSARYHEGVRRMKARRA